MTSPTSLEELSVSTVLLQQWEETGGGEWGGEMDGGKSYVSHHGSEQFIHGQLCEEVNKPEEMHNGTCSLHGDWPPCLASFRENTSGRLSENSQFLLSTPTYTVMPETRRYGVQPTDRSQWSVISANYFS